MCVNRTMYKNKSSALRSIEISINTFQIICICVQRIRNRWTATILKISVTNILWLNLCHKTSGAHLFSLYPFTYGLPLLAKFSITFSLCVYVCSIPLFNSNTLFFYLLLSTNRQNQVNRYSFCSVDFFVILLSDSNPVGQSRNRKGKK